MTIMRTRTARDLVSLAGRWPSAALTVTLVTLFSTPSSVWAQPQAPAQTGAAAQPAPAKPRDPMSKDKSDTKVAVSEHMTVDLHVKDEDLNNVLELLSIQTQKNIVASKGVGGKVTATLYGVTFYQALDAILHVNGFGYIENGNFIYVYTKDELKQIEASLKKRVSKVIKLNYLNADDAKTFVEPLLSKDGGEVKTSAKVPNFNIPDKSPVGKNDYALGDTLVVTDFEENVKAIEELVKQIDTKPAQVLVEATILQTSLNEANAFGVDFSIIGDINFGDFINIGGPLAAANALVKGGNGTSGQGFSPQDNQGHAITSSPGNAAGPATFKVGVIAGDVAIFMRMLDQVTDSVVISNPKILALNRQPARVLVGKRVGYLNTTSTETSTTQTVEFLDTGTQLIFRPFVSNDGQIRMELKPQVSAAEIRNVTDAKGATVTIPDEVTQEMVTNVIIKDGQTVVLGGLFTESSTFTRSQVPWVGDIPIIGAAFRGHDDATQRSEIIFLITPTLISDAQIAAAAERTSSDIDRIRTGTRQGLLPWSREKMTDLLNVEAEKYAREGNYERAMFNIRRSLSLNANQPEVYRLRERITNEREVWNDPSMLDYAVNNAMSKRIDAIKPWPEPFKVKKPYGSVKPVYEPVTRPLDDAPGSNKRVQDNDLNPENPPMAEADQGPQAARTPTGMNPSGAPNSPQGEEFFGASSGVQAGATPASFPGASSQAPDGASMGAASGMQAGAPSAAPAGTSFQAPAGGRSPAYGRMSKPVDPTLSTPAQLPPMDLEAALAAQNSGQSMPSNFAVGEPVELTPGNVPQAALTVQVQASVAEPEWAAQLQSQAGTGQPEANQTNPTEPNAEQPAQTFTQTPEQLSQAQGQQGFSGSLQLEPLTLTPGANSTSNGAAGAPASATFTSNGAKPATAGQLPTLSQAALQVQQVTNTRKQLTNVRSQVDIYGMMNSGTLPALGFDEQNPWGPLTEANLLKSKPRNEYVGGPNADKIIVRETPDETFQTNYGWIFNPVTGHIWAAGFDGADRPLSRSGIAAFSQTGAVQPGANGQPSATATEMIDAIGRKNGKGDNKSQQTPPTTTTGVETENHK